MFARSLTIGAAEATTWQSDPAGIVESARIDIESSWVGPASQAFVDQLTRIVKCVDSQ